MSSSSSSSSGIQTSVVYGVLRIASTKEQKISQLEGEIKTADNQNIRYQIINEERKKEKDEININAPSIVLIFLGEKERVGAATTELNYQNNLLSQLRSSLKHSQEEMEKITSESSDADLSQIGAIVLEQKRIEAEIKKTKARTNISYNAKQKTKSYQLPPFATALIEDIIFTWIPRLSPVNESIKEEKEEAAVILKNDKFQFVNAINDEAHHLQSRPATPGLFHWNVSSIIGSLSVTNENRTVRCSSSTSCVTAVPPLSSSAESIFKIRIDQADKYDAGCIVIGVQLKAKANSADSYDEKDVLLFDGRYQSVSNGMGAVHQSGTRGFLFHTGDILTFTFNPSSRLLNIHSSNPSLNSYNNSGSYLLPNASSYYIHASFYLAIGAMSFA